MPPLPFPEWLPDMPDFANPGASVVLNVLPRTAQSYGPMASMVGVTAEGLGQTCRGSYSLADNAGNRFTFAGDAAALYKLDPTTNTFLNISKAGGYTLGGPPVGQWVMLSFGNRIIATNYNDPVQTLLLGTDTVFSDLSADAPKAKYAAVVRDFLILANTNDSVAGPQPRRIRWSAIANPINFPTVGTDAAIEVQSDQQDLEQSDLGVITGIIGGFLAAADGAVFCERGIYRVAYIGSPAIFDFTVAEGAAGTNSPLSIVGRRISSGGTTQGVAYYLGEDGFYVHDGATSMPIGASKVDRFFLNDVAPGAVGAVQGCVDPVHKLVFWAYSTSRANPTWLYDKMIVFNWDLNRWASIDLIATPIEQIVRQTTLGLTLDTLDPFGSVDTLPFSLDAPQWEGGTPVLGLFTSDHKLSYSTGSPLAPIVETSEAQPFPGRRTRVLTARPLVDAVGASVAVGHRELLNAAVTYEAAVPVNLIGECPQRVTGRYVRYRLTLPAGTAFNHLQGVDVQMRPEATLR